MPRFRKTEIIFQQRHLFFDQKLLLGIFLASGKKYSNARQEKDRPKTSFLAMLTNLQLPPPSGDMPGKHDRRLTKILRTRSLLLQNQQFNALVFQCSSACPAELAFYEAKAGYFEIFFSFILLFVSPVSFPSPPKKA